MVHKGPLVDVILGLEYQHYDVGSKNAFCFNPGCNPATGWDEDLSAKGDLVRARLTIKTRVTASSIDEALRASGPPRVLCSKRGPRQRIEPPGRGFFFDAPQAPPDRPRLRDRQGPAGLHRLTAASGRSAASTKRAAVPTICAGSGR